MSIGGTSSGSAATLDVGGLASPADNTFSRASTVAGSSSDSPPSYWSGWWKLTPGVNGNLVLDTSDTTGTGNNDTTLWLYQDAGGLFPIGSDDDSGLGRTSRLSRVLTAGVTYYVKVGSYDSSGDGITTFHVAAAFVEMPDLPNPRTFSIPGGGLTDPGVVMGPAVVDAPLVTPLSVSIPTDGATPDATFVFDTAGMDVETAFISFDAILSYLVDGIADDVAPEVGLNVFSAPHPMPITWEEIWDTVEVGANDAIDEYGREVPRGQYQLDAQRGTTYIIQLTTPPGNAVHFVLRASAWGDHTLDQTIPDQAWRVSGVPTSFSTGGGTPTVYSGAETAFARNDALTSFAPRDVSALPLVSTIKPPFHGQYLLARGFAKTHFPGSDVSARDCEWSHARRERNTANNWWTSDGTTNPPDDSPACQAIGSLAEASVIGLTNGTIGWTYASTTTDGSGHETAQYDVYDSQFRFNLNNALRMFGATAGINPADLDAPDGYSNTGAILSGPITGAPDLLGVNVRFEKLTGGASSSQTLRFYCQSVDYDNTDGHQSPTSWGPTSDADATHDWVGGGSASPETWAAAQPAAVSDGAWTALPDAVVTAVQADEAAGPTDGTYDGGLRVVGMCTAQLSDAVPTPQPAMSLGESISQLVTRVYPIMQLELGPTVTYRFADFAEIPLADVEGVDIVGAADPVRRRFF